MEIRHNFYEVNRVYENIVHFLYQNKLSDYVVLIFTQKHDFLIYSQILKSNTNFWNPHRALWFLTDARTQSRNNKFHEKRFFFLFILIQIQLKPLKIPQKTCYCESFCLISKPRSLDSFRFFFLEPIWTSFVHHYYRNCLPQCVWF